VSSQRMKIGDFLLRRLKEAGVRHLFGVPGDYNLELLQLLQDTGALKWIGTCSELNASYAADGNARLNGLGAVLVTNGVGALSAINGVGGSGTWGGEIRAEFAPQPGEIVAAEHWCSSGFANTDLDLQLKKHGIHQLIVIGLIAHTCIEATVRYAAELGYDVTVVKDATADYSDEMMHAALDINIPNYASAIGTAEELVTAIAAM
jgi:nicotinamidase-related amidase